MRGDSRASRRDAQHENEARFYAAMAVDFFPSPSPSESNPRNRAAESSSDTTAYFVLPREAERWYEGRDQTVGGVDRVKSLHFCWKRILGSQNGFGSSEHVLPRRSDQDGLDCNSALTH